MRLGDFILANVKSILADWEEFARSLAPGSAMGVIALRDHAEDILRATARDMASSQSAQQQADKSKGHGGGGTESARLDGASKEHALARLGSGFNLIEVVSEYRALRASVLRLWGERIGHADEHDLQDLTRFNESMDRSFGEAVRSYTNRVDESRELFLATLGHDLRNPLNAIVVSSALLARSAQLDEENTQVALQMSKFANVMSRMIQDLLDFYADPARRRNARIRHATGPSESLPRRNRRVSNCVPASDPAIGVFRRHQRRMGRGAIAASRLEPGCQRNRTRRR